MRRLLPPLRASAATGLLLAAAASLAASPPPSGGDPLPSLQSAYARAVLPGEQADGYRELFATVFQRVQRSYATEVDLGALAAEAMKILEPLEPGTAEPREVFSRAINAALGSLDPYSRYLDAQAAGNARGSSGAAFGGVGLEVEAGEGAVRVVAPIPGTPAAQAGLRAGDLIVRIDDQPLHDVPLPDAIAKMRGAPGTAVVITVRRTGMAEAFTVSLTRATIRRQALRWHMEGEVLVLGLSSFSTSVATALRQAVADATAAHAPRAVVLDLRGNPGGLLHEAVRTADAFLAQGDIVSLRGRTPGNQRSWQADPDEVLAGLPMVVMLDRRSASASELVAAALQDNGRATIMGQRSYGKGSVQTTYSLKEEFKGALKLTSAFYLSPSGRSVQKTGVFPDIELLAAASPQKEGPSEREAPVPPGAPQARVEQAQCAAIVKAADAALACAVAYLQAGGVDAFTAGLAHRRPTPEAVLPLQ
ncbi:MAG TPA: S41 family peptidase [Ramlibacter sp.]|nr:S41 family peptidase [Ramlibacter sp.]